MIASGGLGQVSDLGQISRVANVSAVACAHVLHYEKFQIQEIKEALAAAGKEVRV